jgi:hypothetical protein
MHPQRQRFGNSDSRVGGLRLGDARLGDARRSVRGWMSRRATATVVGVLVTAILGGGAPGCGDDLQGPAPPLAPADRLVIVAHLDDDLIFMQPEVHDAVASGSVTTVYVSSGDPVKGDGVALHTFGAAMMAYTSAAGSHDWDCGFGLVAGSPVHHCRLRDRPVSMIGLDTADGGTDGEFRESPLHLVEGLVPSIAILGQLRGRATVDSITAELAEIIAVTAPSQIDTLDLAATHGSDHSGHMFAATFALWAAARAGYDGPMRWHRGYNVGDFPPTLADSDYVRVKPMLGYFEACYFGCAPCGTSCATLAKGHDDDLQRQYWTAREPIAAAGGLALEDGARCVSVTAEGALVLADCAGAAALRLDADGHLMLASASAPASDARCLTSQAGTDDPVVLAPCQATPAQYWIVDGDGVVWNGLPPRPTADMAYNHVRCLSTDAVGGGASPPGPSAITAPICGARLHPHWRFVAR